MQRKFYLYNINIIPDLVEDDEDFNGNLFQVESGERMCGLMTCIIPFADAIKVISRNESLENYARDTILHQQPVYHTEWVLLILKQKMI